MEINEKEKNPTTKLGDQETRYLNDTLLNQEWQGKNEEELQELSPYYHDAKGRLMVFNGDTEVVVSEWYIKLRAFSRDLNGENWMARVEFKDLDDKLKTLDIPRQNLIDIREVTKVLAAAGYPTYCSKMLHAYLKTEKPKERFIYVNRTGWANRSLDYIYNTFQVVDSNKKYVYSANVQPASSGTMEEWGQNICRYCIDNHVLTLALCVSLSGIFMNFQHSVNTTILNLTGKSSIGKTTALQITASVWNDKKFIKQWRATSNALESIAENHNDGLLILDELGQVSGKDVSQIFYMLGNEQGKGRMNADSTLRKSKTWKLSILSSGEVGITDKIEETGTKVKAGQLVRCIDIDANIGEYGIYNTLNGLSNGAELSNLLKRNCSKYHGIVAEEFVKKLVQNQTYDTLRNDIDKILKAEYERMNQKFNLNNADGQVQRVADVFALYSITGLYASKFGIFTHTKKQIRESIDFCFDRWLNDRGGKGAYEEQDIIEALNGFLIQNENRFHNWDFPNGSVVNCLGYMKKTPIKITYYILPESFKSEFCKKYLGTNYKIVRSVLIKNQLLKVDPNGYSPRIILPDGTRSRMMCLNKNKD